MIQHTHTYSCPIIGREERKNMAKYFTFYERTKIETLLENGVKPVEIAEQLNRSFTAVYREIKKGTVVQKDTNLKLYTKYLADAGQRKQDKKGHNKGAKTKLKNEISTLKKIQNLVIKEKSAPYAISVILGRADGCTPICTGTIYSYIHKGIIPDVTDKDLTYKTKKKKNKDREHTRIRYQKSGAKSIEDRPKEVKDRTAYGNWEMDTVYSGKDKSKSCLLVLTERMTREERIYKIKDRTAQSVLDKINEIEKEIGTDNFKNIFKTITADNGGEFALHTDIEKSCVTDTQRTALYFCHPFASCERGSNENANKLIRKYIKKGEDIGNYTDGQIKEIEDRINNYPRRLFGGLSTNEYKRMLGIA